jgi:hypothetical protein
MAPGHVTQPLLFYAFLCVASPSECVIKESVKKVAGSSFSTFEAATGRSVLSQELKHLKLNRSQHREEPTVKIREP